MMFSVVLKALPSVEIGAAMRLKALIIMFGPAIGPTLSGMLLGVFSWRAIFFTFTLALAVAALAPSNLLPLGSRLFYGTSTISGLSRARICLACTTAPR